MDSQDVKRKYFRISVKGNDDISVKVNEVEYEVFDVAEHGIGIRFTPEDILVAVGDELPIELKIMGAVYNLKGKVVHISPTGPEEFLCGIDLINLDKQSKDELLSYLQSCKEKVFGED